jgi:hypothetical protein
VQLETFEAARVVGAGVAILAVRLMQCVWAAESIFPPTCVPCDC